MNTIIEKMTAHDWEEVAHIYSQGIQSRQATFETHCPDWESWDKSHRPDGRLVARQNGKIIGWAALSYVSGRQVYAGVAEVSVYVDFSFQGQGVGQKLMGALIKESEDANIWTLQSGILAENKTSIRLHQKHGFRLVGVREKIGQRDGQWRDIILMERRSTSIGIGY